MQLDRKTLFSNLKTSIVNFRSWQQFLRIKQQQHRIMDNSFAHQEKPVAQRKKLGLTSNDLSIMAKEPKVLPDVTTTLGRQPENCFTGAVCDALHIGTLV